MPWVRRRGREELTRADTTTQTSHMVTQSGPGTPAVQNDAPARSSTAAEEGGGNVATQARGGRSIDTFTHASTLGAQVAQAVPEGEPLLPPARRSSLQAWPPVQATAEDEPGVQQPAASAAAEVEDTRTAGGCESGSRTGGDPAADERSPARLGRLGSSPRVSVTPPQALHNQLAELRRMQVGAGARAWAPES
jgi:hypothetical protein